MLLLRSLPLLVSKESLLSRHPSALNARFKLLLLGINMLQEDILTNSAIKNVLRERIYTNALDYFRFVVSRSYKQVKQLIHQKFVCLLFGLK